MCKILRFIAPVALAGLLLAGCGRAETPTPTPTRTPVPTFTPTVAATLTPTPAPTDGPAATRTPAGAAAPGRESAVRLFQASLLVATIQEAALSTANDAVAGQLSGLDGTLRMVVVANLVETASTTAGQVSGLDAERDRLYERLRALVAPLSRWEDGEITAQEVAGLLAGVDVEAGMAEGGAVMSAAGFDDAEIEVVGEETRDWLRDALQDEADEGGAG